MAKAKSNSKKITLEESLVPVEEQPYEVPENWCWVKHNSILDISGGSQPAKSHFITEPREGYTQLYQTRDYGEHPIPVYIPNKYATKTTCEGDILLARYGGSLGKVFRAHDGAYNVALTKVIKIYPELIDDEFLYKYYLSQFYQNFCIKASNGRSAQAGFNRDDMNSLPFPLPPLAEQKRIVDQIESLFSKLDEANEKAQEVIDRIETNIEAILYNAFSGKLTQYWRKENGVDYNWENSTLSKIVSGLKYGSSEKSDYNNNGTPVLRIPNIGEGVIDFSDLKYMQGELGNSYHEVFENDILIIRSNGSRDLVGKCAIVPALERRYAYASFLIRIKASDKVLPKYLVRYINSSMARGQLFAKAKSSSGIHNINSKELGSIRIDVPTIEEQTEILKIIEPLIKKELDVKDITSNMIENIAELKKSILAKAFRGELGTNVSSEENSIELIKKMIGRDKIERKD